MVHNLANAAAKYGIYVDVGDDVEGGPQWDCYSSTYPFYYGMTTYGVNLLYWDDFGDVAYLEGGCNQGSNWTEGQLEQITLFFNNSQEDEDSIAQCYYNNGGVASPGAWGDYAQQGGTYLLASLAENLSGTLSPQTAYVDLTNDSLQSGILYSDLIYRPPYPY